MIVNKYMTEIKNEIRLFYNDLVKANAIILNSLKENNINKFDDAKILVNNSTLKADKIDNLIIKSLALYSPEARDLRRLVAYLKITSELLRASTNTKSFIKGFLSVYDLIEKDTINNYLIPLEEASLKCLELTYEMLDIEDVDELKDKFEEIIVEEHKTDDLYDAIEEELLKNNKSDYKTLNKILKTIRKMEKIADRSIEIANLLMFYKLGGTLNNA
jgi:phosphate transport system protein